MPFIITVSLESLNYLTCWLPWPCPDATLGADSLIKAAMPWFNSNHVFKPLKTILPTTTTTHTAVLLWLSICYPNGKGCDFGLTRVGSRLRLSLSMILCTPHVQPHLCYRESYRMPVCSHNFWHPSRCNACRYIRKHPYILSSCLVGASAYEGRSRTII